MEDAPAPNALSTFDVVEKNGAVYIKGEESAIKSGQRDPAIKCSATSPEKVVVIGGYVLPALVLCIPVTQLTTS